jgi:arylsulfatase A-like enzyme
MKLTFFKYVFFFIAIYFVSCAKINKENAIKEPKKPNVLFILVDDLGINDLSVTGSSYYETPNIDALANSGFIFTQGYANSRVCSPSRASILTGKFTANHGITDWIGEKSGEDWRKMNRFDKLLPPEYLHNLPKEEITIAETMKANGYKTFFAGKWHLGNEGSYPEDHGFDINKGGWDKGGPVGGYFSSFKNAKLKDTQDGENLSMRLAEETGNFIQKNQKNPFFAFLSFYAVHGPIQTTNKKWKKYRDKAASTQIKENGFMMERKLPIRISQDNPIYAGLVESMDDAVGYILQKLKENKLDKNTIVIFTSDNGGVSSGDSFSTSNLPYKGGKGYQWEGGIREPYFIYVPWLASKKPKLIDYPVTGADFYPTILDYAKIDLLPNQHQDGISLKPIIDGVKNLEERALYWHYPHYGNQGGDPSSIIRKGSWKLIHYYEQDSNELYNLSKDPYEKNDVSKSFSEKAQNLNQELMDWLVKVDAKYPSKDEKFDAEKRKVYDKNVRIVRLPKLEKERVEMLQPDFSPNKDWWGSKFTKD